MNAAILHLDRASEAVISLGRRLRGRPVVGLDITRVADAVMAVGARISSLPRDPEQPDPTLDAIPTEYGTFADHVMSDRDVALAAGELNQSHAHSAVYLYLKGFAVWGATVRGEEERARTLNFGLALILLGKNVALRHNVTDSVERLAYAALSTDMHLREVLRYAVDALVEARSGPAPQAAAEG